MAKEKCISDMFLVNCNFNWADEFDLAGFELLSRGELLIMKKKMKMLDRDSDYDYEYEIGFGTNESLMYSPSDVIDIIDDVLKQKPLSDKDAKVIERVFDDYSTAVISLSEIVDRIWEEATDNGFEPDEDVYDVDEDDEDDEDEDDEDDED